MIEDVKQAIYAHFKSYGSNGGKPVQSGNFLGQAVKSNLHYTLKPYYDEAVQDLVDDGFLIYSNGVPPVSGVTLGTLAGYRITAEGVAWLAKH